MTNWPVQDAKARFSAFLKAALTQGPQVVTMRGTEAAVLVPVEEWRRLNARARPEFKALLTASDARGELTLPARGGQRRRAAQQRS